MNGCMGQVNGWTSKMNRSKYTLEKHILIPVPSISRSVSQPASEPSDSTSVSNWSSPSLPVDRPVLDPVAISEPPSPGSLNSPSPSPNICPLSPFLTTSEMIICATKIDKEMT